jgi:cytochrome c oxidase subunit 2
LAVSNTAELFASLFGTFTALAFLVGGVVLGLMLYLILKYRDKDPSIPEPEDTPQLGKLPPERGHRRTILVSLSLSTVIVSVLIGSTFVVIDTLTTPPAEETLTVNVVAFQWGWKFIYPDGREVAGELRLPKDRVVVLNITSQDVFHTAGIPDFKLKKDALPGKHNVIWFEAFEAGSYRFLCFELCGTGHAFMKGNVIVMEPNEFQNWYSAGVV